MKKWVDGVESDMSPEEEAEFVASQPGPMTILTGDAQDQEVVDTTEETPGARRAMMLLMREEINKLRVLNGEAAYTLAEFKALMKAKVRG